MVYRLPKHVGSNKFNFVPMTFQEKKLLEQVIIVITVGCLCSNITLLHTTANCAWLFSFSGQVDNAVVMQNKGHN